MSQNSPYATTYLNSHEKSFSLLDTYDNCNQDMVENFSRNMKIRQTTLTKEIVAFNPAKLDILSASDTKSHLRAEMHDSEKILKLAQCHPDIIKATPQLFFIKCGKLLAQQKKKLQEKERHLKQFCDRINNSNLDFVDYDDQCDEEDKFLTKETKKDNSCDRSTAENTFIKNSPSVSAFDTKMVSSFDAADRISCARVNSMFSESENVQTNSGSGIFNLNQSLQSIGNLTMVESNQSICEGKVQQTRVQKQESDAQGFRAAIKSALIFILLATVVGLLVIK